MSSSSTTKVRLISEAPCEIMRTLMLPSAPKTFATMPGVSRMFSPTRQTSAFFPSYFTSANFPRSAASAGIPSLESTVRETLTPEIETASTARLCLSNVSKIERRKPCVERLRAAATSTRLMRFLTAMALKALRHAGAVACTHVPSHCGLREFRTYTGMLRCTAGSTVAGCRTLAPK